MNVFTSEIGTKLPIRDVRYPVANRGRPDMARTAQFGRECPGADIAKTIYASGVSHQTGGG